LKRLFDILAAGFGLLLFLPLLLVVMWAIRIESPGSAIFRQRRTGYRGQVFTIYKFRTMTVTEDCGQIRHATKNDARVTEVGALLRKLSIDELPQLWNVLKGDMSIVGPCAGARRILWGADPDLRHAVPGQARAHRLRPGQRLPRRDPRRPRHERPGGGRQQLHRGMVAGPRPRHPRPYGAAHLPRSARLLTKSPGKRIMRVAVGIRRHTPAEIIRYYELFIDGAAADGLLGCSSSEVKLAAARRPESSRGSL
jgi:hypothetical protein